MFWRVILESGKQLSSGLYQSTYLLLLWSVPMYLSVTALVRTSVPTCYYSSVYQCTYLLLVYQDTYQLLPWST